MSPARRPKTLQATPRRAACPIDRERRRVGGAIVQGLALGLATPLLGACGGGGAGATVPAAPSDPPTGHAVAFNGNVVLGAPTDTSVQANVFAPDQEGTVWLTYGTRADALDGRTPDAALTAGRAVTLSLQGLAANTRYHCRIGYRAPDGTGASDVFTFHTARPPGSTFTFTVQGDSHPERDRTQFDAALYLRTLSAAAADAPDFHLAMGDDFSVDTLDPASVNAALVTQRYTMQRPWLSTIARQAPLFLVNGNHEQAARYLLDGTPDNVAVWAQNARNGLYPQPGPGDFYSGNAEPVPYIGLLRNWYAWTWGDALFIVIDPYWSTALCVDAPFTTGTKRADLWDITLGEAQYQWLRATLQGSTARHKFVFAHHVLGTGRGGIAMAGRAEWGGQDPGGSATFGVRRPGWAAPIHTLMATHGVKVFFQGHDHLWARETLDGVTYQTLPEPADPAYALYNADAYPTAERWPSTGYARVTVSPEDVLVEYVRTWLPQDEDASRTSGTVASRYRLT